jgi:hypothetical protein
MKDFFKAIMVCSVIGLFASLFHEQIIKPSVKMKQSLETYRR